jgi:hypothetical protein
MSSVIELGDRDLLGAFHEKRGEPVGHEGPQVCFVGEAQRSERAPDAVGELLDLRGEAGDLGGQRVHLLTRRRQAVLGRVCLLVAGPFELGRLRGQLGAFGVPFLDPAQDGRPRDGPVEVGLDIGGERRCLAQGARRAQQLLLLLG